MPPPRHILITGAGTGIGRAIALRFARQTATLTLAARRRPPLEETAELALAAGAPAVHIETMDIRERTEVERAFAQARRKNGPLHTLVANAGEGGANAPDDTPTDRFHTLVATNLTGTYHTLRAAQTHLAPGPDARHLIVVSSILARIGVPGYTGYCASKAGLLGLVRALAAELAPQEVQVNAVCPGWVDTAMAREGLEGMAEGMGIDFEAAHAKAMEQVPLGRMSAPEDIAGLVAWLASPDARGVTGQGLDMNGGAFMA